MSSSSSDPTPTPIETTKRPRVASTETEPEIKPEKKVELDPGETVIPFGKYKGKKIAEVPHSYLHWVSCCVPETLLPTYSIKTPRLGRVDTALPMLFICYYFPEISVAAHRFLYAKRDVEFRAKIAELVAVADEKEKATKHHQCASCGRGMPPIHQDNAGWDRRFHKGCWKELLGAEQKAAEAETKAKSNVVGVVAAVGFGDEDLGGGVDRSE